MKARVSKLVLLLTTTRISLLQVWLVIHIFFSVFHHYYSFADSAGMGRRDYQQSLPHVCHGFGPGDATWYDCQRNVEQDFGNFIEGLQRPCGKCQVQSRC